MVSDTARGGIRALGPWLLAGAAGGLQAVSIAVPRVGLPLWWLQLASLALLVAVLARARDVGQAAGLGLLFAVTWLAGSWWWLFISMHVYGGLPSPLAVLAVWALAAALGLYYAVAAALAWWLGAARLQATGAPPVRANRVSLAAVFSGAWLLAELARGRWLTGFPWGAGGYAHVDGPLAFLAPWIGVYGIGWVAALLAGLVALVVIPPPAPALTGPLDPRATPRDPRRQAAGALLGVLLALGGVRLLPLPAQPSTGTMAVSLLQGNIPQNEKFQAGTGISSALTWYGQALRTSPGALVVAPETALPLLPQELPAGYLQEIDEHFRGGQQALLIGLPLGDASRGYTNSALGLAPGTDAYRYDKHHLVPFGEFIPRGFRWFTEMMNIPLGDFARGAVGQPSLAWNGQRLAPNICYEDLFGEELAARFVNPGQAPTIFVNLSNIAWFGDSVAIEQHLQISRMRALEFRRPMLRATNTGATAIIDAEGQVTHRLPRLTRGTLQGEVEGRSGLTPYAVWASAWGLGPLWLLGVAIVVLWGWVRVPAPRLAPGP